MTSALAMFGNRSAFFLASNMTNSTAQYAFSAICSLGALPLTQLVDSIGFQTGANQCLILPDMLSRGEEFIYDTLITMMYTYVSALNDSAVSSEVLGAATYFANEAVLRGPAEQGGLSGYARWIFTAPWTLVPNPQWSTAAIVTVSILIGLQGAGLAAIAGYIHSMPSWTDKLDAFAMMHIGAELKRAKRVRLIGIRDADQRDLETLEKPFKLALGAPGLISKRLARPKTKKRSTGRKSSTMPAGIV